MYFWYIWQTYSPGITKKELTINVKIQEQTASLYYISRMPWISWFQNHGQIPSGCGLFITICVPIHNFQPETILKTWYDQILPSLTAMNKLKKKIMNNGL